MAAGILIYFIYGRHHSVMSRHKPEHHIHH
jgi:hypothetical protein